eukprot:3475271-Rhodomonas_salina.2
MSGTETGNAAPREYERVSKLPPVCQARVSDLASYAFATRCPVLTLVCCYQAERQSAEDGNVSHVGA